MSTLTPDQLAHWDQSKQPLLYSVTAVLLFLTDTSVIIRFVSQWRSFHRFYTEDWSILFAALISNIVAGFIFWTIARSGLGLHDYRVFAESGPRVIILGFRTVWVIAFLLGPWLLAVKVSLLFFYRRMFLVQQRWLKWAWWINLIYATLWAIATTLYYIFQCLPVSYYWNQYWAKLGLPSPHPVHGTCVSSTEILIGLPLIFSLVSDIGILLLPTVTLAHLQIPLKKKIGLCIIFGCGILWVPSLGRLVGADWLNQLPLRRACVCEGLRIWSEVTVTPKLTDPSYGGDIFILTNYAEPNVAIVAACMPMMASQWRWTRQKLCSTLRSWKRSKDLLPPTSTSSDEYLSRFVLLVRKISASGIFLSGSKRQRGSPSRAEMSRKAPSVEDVGQALGETLQGRRIAVTTEIDVESARREQEDDRATSWAPWAQ